LKKNCHPNQLSFFDLLKDLRPKNTEFSSFNIDILLRETIALAIKESPLSRFQIAARMSESLGVEVSKTMIDSWTAESREGINRFPACYLPAFCHVVESIEPLRVLADLVGSVVVQGEDALHMELSKVEAEKQRLSEKGKAIKTILQGMRK
jgi:hypothetical protein